MENLPNKLDATCRQGATFGPVYLQVAGIDLNRTEWPYIGAKAGNLPGDLTFSWYAVDRSGQAWVVSFQLNWPRYHSPNAGGWVMTIIKQVFGMLPR